MSDVLPTTAGSGTVRLAVAGVKLLAATTCSPAGRCNNAQDSGANSCRIERRQIHQVMLTPASACLVLTQSM